MKIIICGAGRVGYGIAERLAAEHIDVTVIDLERRLIELISDRLEVRGIVGHGAHPDVLARAGAAEADMIIAVTLHDEINMVACQVAHSLFNVPTKIARVRAQSYLQPGYQNLFSRDNLPIDLVISPEREVAEMVVRRMARPGALDVLSVADGNVTVLAVACAEDCPLVDTPLRQLTNLFPDLQAVIVGIRRGPALFIPRADDSLQVGDIAYITVGTQHIARMLALFGHEEQEARRIVIAGGGHIGFYVARAMEQRNHRGKVKIIEADRTRALEISDDLAHTTVLHGSALDQALLREADTQDADLMVALTNQDQVNVLSAMMAKRMGCKLNMVLLNDPVYEEFTHTDGIDAHIDPRSVTVSRILQQLRRGRIRAVYSLSEGRAEIIEAQALETSPLVGKPLSELQLPDGIRFGAIYRNGEIIRPVATSHILAGDRVIIFARSEAVRHVEQMFRVSLEFF
ncbi:MAG: Potassium transporter peripheral membrane component [Candidatus Tokpelaia hoelldobleri]|uniref:Trk system potassium uptake protein TrkA n=1 Tax=Candidatus Tokpelaia hoelldobleri TaxID=1902579 RepID=A0A1U9JU76_9HYPH|nr:MAG: Potassium transporter peripheral membrane component [Candidatus Tokpelaia hoelldoblerii]